jgi:hypothetical protein
VQMVIGCTEARKSARASKGRIHKGKTRQLVSRSLILVEWFARQRFLAVSLGHLRWVGLDLVLAGLAPHDDPDFGRRSIPKRHRRAGCGFHPAS